ncbi:hypothetical protein E4U47_001960 [Claviceps purpurea]|nr:hypothetical protein E4U47_001960 [Claviceps purpurea]
MGCEDDCWRRAYKHEEKLVADSVDKNKMHLPAADYDRDVPAVNWRQLYSGSFEPRQSTVLPFQHNDWHHRTSRRNPATSVHPSMAMTAAVRFLSSKQGSSGLGFIQLQLRVKPGVSKTRQGILAVTSNAVELCVAAQPRQGEANFAVLRVLSKALDICQSRLRIVRGSKSRDKIAAFDCHLADGPGPAYAEVILNLLREASDATPPPC